MSLCLRLLCMFISICLASQLLSAEPVRRQTDSVETDLISALISRDQLELAARICESHLNETQLEDDVLARWLIQAARIDNAFGLQQDAASNQSDDANGSSNDHSRLASARRIDQFLVSHPDYPQRSWLQFQRVLNELSLITREALTVLVSSGVQQQAGRERVLTRIVRAQTDLRDLSKDVEQQINEARSRTPANGDVQDLVSLVYQIAEKRLSTVLLQGELFEPGAQDSIASATEAMTATKKMLDSLPAGLQTRAKFLQLYAEALRRLSRFDEALAAIDEALAIDRRSGEFVATAVRINLNAGRLAQAQQRISTYQSASSAGDVEFDLVLLEFMIAQAKQASRAIDQQGISQQIQRIRERHGAYAKRRAQRIALGIIPTESSEISDPELLIARAGQWLRDGKADEAVDGLMTAARATKSAKDAITLAVAAAAIERKRGAFSAAADGLREISLAFPDEAEAPKLHYQASLLMRDHWPAPALIEQLQEFLNTWPRDPLAGDAVKWLDLLLEATKDHVTAARVLTAVGITRTDDTLLRTAYDRWTTAMARSETSDHHELAEEAIKQFQASASDTALCLSLQLSLLTLPADQVQPVTKPAFALLQRRACFLWLAPARGLSFLNADAALNNTITPEGFTLDERALAINRLVQDARPARQTDLRAVPNSQPPQSSPLTQSRAGKALLEIDRVQTLPLDLKTQAYDWFADYATSRSLVPADLQANDPSATKIAAVLASSADAESRRVALTLWNQIAARLPLGSESWHQAKLAFLDLLVTSNQQAEASRLAEYILLTQKPTDPDLLTRYQAYIKRPS